ncbi:hypothetical protein [Lactiplantibacillus daowaiensis]|uniref:Uncharacterized protein n=1 Tax=Lactiplantibacillus daowaiensis TaxID=2559918 RepID=A0ABW1S3V7_9LACO
MQLGWYENIAAAKRELTAIEAALIKRQSHYDLQFTAPETSKQPLRSWSATLTKWRHRLHAKK